MHVTPVERNTNTVANYSSTSRPLSQARTNHETTHQTSQHTGQQNSLDSHNIFIKARLQAKQGSLLADILFARSFDSPVPERLSELKQSQDTEESSLLAAMPILWFRLSPLTRVELGAYVAALFAEPDGLRLVRAVVGALEHLGLTSLEDICQALQMRAPELFAIPLVFPYDDVLVLLKQYLLMSSTTPHASYHHTNTIIADTDAGVSCGNCGRRWPLTSARNWLHFESFVCGFGCPACQADFKKEATNPGDGRI
jgi:hypothetical protein